MPTPDAPRHRLNLADIGRIEQDGILVEVHSRGGSLFGFKKLIDELSKRQALEIRTLYDNKLGAGYLGVVFAEHNAQLAAEKLDEFLSHHDEFSISGYFSDAVEATGIAAIPQRDA